MLILMYFKSCEGDKKCDTKAQCFRKDGFGRDSGDDDIDDLEPASDREDKTKADSRSIIEESSITESSTFNGRRKQASRFLNDWLNQESTG